MGVTMEPLKYGDRVIVKTGQSTAIKIDIMKEWGKPLWPIDMTSIPLGEVSRIVPSLVGQVFFDFISIAIFIYRKQLPSQTGEQLLQ